MDFKDCQEDLVLAEALLEAIAKYRVPYHSAYMKDGPKRAVMFGPPLLSRDTEGMINFYSLKTREVFLWQPEEILGEPSSILVPDDQREIAGELYERVLEEDGYIFDEVVRLDKEGNRIFISAFVFPYETEQGRSIVAKVRKVESLEEVF